MGTRRIIDNKDALIARAKSMRGEGLSFEAISKVVGVGQSTLQRWLNPASAQRHRDRARELYQDPSIRTAIRQRQSESLAQRMKSIAYRTRQAVRKIQLKAEMRGHSACTTPLADIVSAFDGQCAICGVDECDCAKRLALDHDHQTGEFRGWLCEKCNRRLGHVEVELMPMLRYLFDKGSREQLLKIVG